MQTRVNPILNGDYPDPSIVRRGDDYYMTYSCTNQMPGLKILHSRDLVHWKTIGAAVPNTGCIAAPDLIWHEGLFYLYYPANKTNYVTTAVDPAGPWSEPVDLHIPNIDPGHVVAPDGTRYLYMNKGDAYELSADGLHVTKSFGKVYDGWDYDPELHTEGKWLESPKFFVRDGMYYLVSAQGGTAGPSTAHMCIVARSRHPLGPWENSPYNPLVHTWGRTEKWWCKGHGTIFKAADDQWYIVYHAYERGYLTHGRKTLLQKVEWTEDGWPIVSEDAAQEALPYAAEGESDELTDTFEGGCIKPYWSFWNRYEQERISASPMGGLRLAGRGTVLGDSCPMTAPCGEKAYTVSVDVEREGDACGGLTLFYDEHAHVGIALTQEGLRLYKYGKPYVLISGAWKRVTLMIVNDDHDVSYRYRPEDGEWTAIDFGCEVSGVHHNALNGYNSLRPGVFACGEGAVHFKDFAVTALKRPNL